MSRAKDTGTAWETAVARWFRERGAPDATRLALAGSADRGDVDLRGTEPVVIECKAVRNLSLSTALGELERELVNAAATIGFVVAKRTGSTDVGRAYFSTTAEVVRGILARLGIIEDVPDPAAPRACRACGQAVGGA